ncbi:hypothetical protein [Pelagicoccus sp. SDUM812002]|uniref:sodium:calcium antiporter n=1 Tax=Pelagicoccus sp. SDUM812002 TaxID=3041266 RepID=UPI00280CDD9D|nr:hypothetical protein [Pelagicoccus sp. SDUM812002]MDQ8186200.1 hypothetical protein [Pelagicoccus sp. SDUM812002]
MSSLFEGSLATSVLGFAICAVAIGYLGTLLATTADQLADRTGVGEALMGGMVLGAVTSISGSVLSVSAAYSGQAHLALGNALGGIGAQMLFLVVADTCYRRANLEHAAASVENIMQGGLLVCMLAVLLMASYSPPWTLWGVHPATPLLFVAYFGGMVLVNRSKTEPMWKPVSTAETRVDEPEHDNEELGLLRLWIRFLILGLALGIAGWVLQKAASSIVELSGLDVFIMGILLTSVATSLPELVTSIAAVRRGALTLAVSGILGGNAYDSLFAAFSDIAYRDGSIYHKMTPTLSFWIAINIAMSGVLIMGLLLRERKGMVRIGFESVSVGVLYVIGVLVLVFGVGEISVAK